MTFKNILKRFFLVLGSELLSVLIQRHQGFQLGIRHRRIYIRDAFASLRKRGSGVATIKGPKIGIDWEEKTQEIAKL